MSIVALFSGARAKLKALNKSQAIIEFRPDGTIITANNNFLDVMGYTLGEVKDKHHRIFTEPTYAASQEYKDFWAKLGRGEYQASQYKRLGKGGREVWIEAFYNPIIGITGRPYKIIKYATDITQQKLKNADYEGQIDAIGKSQAVIHFELDGTIIWANKHFLDAMGYALEEVKGKHHSIFAEPAYAASQEYKDFWAKLRRGEFQAAQYKRLGKDGREVWIEASYNPIMDMNGRPFKVVKYATDITQQKLNNADYEGQIDAIGKSQAVIHFELDGTIISANKNFLDAMGYTLEEVMGKHHSIFAEPAYAISQEYKDFWAKLGRGEYQAAEYRRLGKGGREVWIQASYNPIMDMNGKPFKVVKYATDITQAVQQREKFNILSLVANETDNSVVISGPEGLIEYVNPGFTRLTGYSQEEAMGQKPGKLLQGPHTDLETVSRIRAKLDKQEPFYDEILNYNKCGESYWISLSINPVFDKQGKLERYISIQANVSGTKLKALESSARIDAIELSNVVIEWDKNNLPIKLNSLAADVLGLHSEHDSQINAMLDYSHIFTPEEKQKLIQGIAFNKDFSLKNKEGTDIYLAGTVQPMHNVEGRLNRTVVIATDTTARRRAIKETESIMETVLKQVSDTAQNISAVSGQTNLLALNATIESARAGDAGKGFAVVASEVKMLAKKSAELSAEIADVVEQTRTKIETLNRMTG